MKPLVLFAVLLQAAPPDGAGSFDMSRDVDTYQFHSVDGPRLQPSRAPASPPTPVRPTAVPPLQTVANDQLPQQVPQPGPPAPATEHPSPVDRADTENPDGYWTGFFSALFMGISAVAVACILWDQHHKRQQRFWTVDREVLKNRAARLQRDNESLRDTIIRKIDHVFNTGDSFNIDVEVTNDGVKAKCGRPGVPESAAVFD